MTQITDHSGLYYVELIKSNLQFIYGKECFLEVLSQVKAPDQWQVSILKTEDGSRSVAFSDSGAGLLGVLEKLHRKSAEMMSKFISDNAADAYTYVKNKKTEAAKTAKAASGKDQMQENKKKQKDEDAVSKAAVPLRERPGLSLLRMDSDSDDSDDADFKIYKAPNRWRAASPSHEIVSIESDSSLRSRSLICPNYGPASAFYRVSPHVPDVLGTMALFHDHQALLHEHEALFNDHEAVNSFEALMNSRFINPIPVAPVPAPDAVKTPAQAQAKAQVKWEAPPHDSVRMQMENHQRRRPANPLPSLKKVLLVIRWPGYGQTMVADECQLSVRAVQSRVRHMLRTYGAALFGSSPDVINPAPFMPNELVNFTVTVKSMSINDQTVVLGPNFGDDIATVAKGLENGKTVKIETELEWKGKDLANMCAV